MATETSWGRFVSVGGGGGDDDASKKHNDVVGGKSAEKKVGVVSWAGFMGLVTSHELFSRFDFLIRRAQLNSPFPDNGEWAHKLLHLVKHGHPDPNKLIGCGIESFQVQQDEMCSCGRTFFIVRKDGSTSKFCFRTCIDNVLPLPENVKVHPSGLVAVCLCHLGDLSAVQAARRGAGRGMTLRKVEEEEEEEEEGATSYTLGTVKFRDSSHMFQFFYFLLIRWPLNEAIREDHHLMLLELLKKGDPDSEKKIGSGIKSFEVRIHPAYDSGLRSFYIVREDGSTEDFCYIKCVDNVAPLTELLRETTAGPCSCHHEEDGDSVVTLGYRKFLTSAEMVQFFKTLFKDRSLNTPIGGQQTRLLILELLKKGDPEWVEKMARSGSGEVQSFQIRKNRSTGNRKALFVVWENGAMESFCFMTCIDNIFPLPKEYKHQSANSRKDRGGGGGRGRGVKGRGGGGRGHYGGGKGGAGKMIKRRRM